MIFNRSKLILKQWAAKVIYAYYSDMTISNRAVIWLHEVIHTIHLYTEQALNTWKVLLAHQIATLLL